MNKINNTKYQQAILYFIQNCNNSYLGKTKLNKLLYYLDFISYRDQGHSVTNDTYINMQYGPIPKNIDDQLDKLVKEGYIDIVDVHIDDKKEKKEFNLKSKLDVSSLTEYELKLLNKICEEFKDWNTATIVDQTHLEAPWIYSEINKDIDWELSKDIDIIKSI